ncbi:bifunctional N(6)-L-threonylcarbamoyladenine synthase/serine/threonine protein kinase [Salinarchaeum sp. IM2453]|uniref:bifunctional N(6)-L-threonylcarbamoyladenine synthase/serine/threonine protein kinase n=1 Tax=Salinarchaeum sp. IM2453 TaxID=2862870 RepID=UPI001C835503|nr:bifunctional N(6)-L-threonylcarbamoyladenine synthase/serine/threonine protein kinase [Salinarchaeum sp. IM2453]QZA89405.1 bifunctional N(6)-L-threonylcarbamoyladenine synthase/serine/threonine protein kinase [Salinarchaeum sp. IM2453]
MRILGLEGTAWAASAALFDVDQNHVQIESDAYLPSDGGIDPQEAASHMADALPAVIDAILDHAADTASPDSTYDIDAIAFSRGPGLGPCLRIVGTAARTLAARLDVPLVGVNHMVAHLEIGRHQSGFDSPICLNASGANAHVLGFHNGKYRILGETMDTGVGNSLDKFARHVGWSHPGGPKVEQAAKEGEYYDLPYVVKGMDFSFAGIVTAAQDAVDDGVPVQNVCTGLQETIFGMLTEVAERALSLTGSDELVLGGGVGQNDRLREMLQEMCEQRGASFYAPEPRFLRDNAGMIAVLGAKMYAAGDTISIDDSEVIPTYRPDEVPVSWRSEESVAQSQSSVLSGSVQGAEATVTYQNDRVTKRRNKKTYRHPELDERLRNERTASEARITSEARRSGIPTPPVLAINLDETILEFLYVGTEDLQAVPTENNIHTVGKQLAVLHNTGIVHGDPTTRNIRVDSEQVYFIDFGLGYYTDHIEDFAMDLHIFDQSITGTVDDPVPLRESLLSGYQSADVTLNTSSVIDRLHEIEGRGRYQ